MCCASACALLLGLLHVRARELDGAPATVLAVQEGEVAVLVDPHVVDVDDHRRVAVLGPTERGQVPVRLLAERVGVACQPVELHDQLTTGGHPHRADRAAEVPAHLVVVEVVADQRAGLLLATRDRPRPNHLVDVGEVVTQGLGGGGCGGNAHGNVVLPCCCGWGRDLLYCTRSTYPR